MNVMFHLHNIDRRTNKVSYQSIYSPSSFTRMDAMNDNLTSTISSSNITIDSPSLSGMNLSFTFRFWFAALSFQIPCLICYVLVLTYILTQKTQHQALHNHLIFLILFIAFSIVLFDYSWTIDSFRRGGEVWLAIPVFYQIWWFLDFGFYSACTVVLAWASFERHILIFHSNLISTKRRLILNHYLSLIFIPIYLLIFYFYAIFFSPCENEYDFTLPVCGVYPCYITIRPSAMWDTVVHGITATLLIFLCNIALLLRALGQKHRHRQDWKKYRKIAFQLFFISALYLSMNLPLMIIATVELAGYPQWGVQLQLYLFFFADLIQWLLPFVCLTYMYLPGIWMKIKAFFIRGNPRVVPTMTARVAQDRRQETKM